MIQLPQLHESLLVANERLVDRARRRARLFRTGLMTSAAVVSIGGAAAAGLAIWNPQLGREDGNRPSLSASPLPTEQQALLGVFRREQTVVDRGVVAQRALIAFSARYRGVRLDAVRSVYQGADGAGIALLPVADLRARDLPGAPALRDALCAFASTDVRASTSDGLTCFGVDEIRSGRVSFGLGDLSWALVPDGVAKVVYTDAEGRDRELPVRSNAVTVARSDVSASRPEVRWVDDDGTVVAPTGGEPMRLQRDPMVPEATSNGFHDCGPRDNGVVPVDVTCGAASRRWTPDAGQAVPLAAPRAK